jgi:hypothetical protein
MAATILQRIADRKRTLRGLLSYANTSSLKPEETEALSALIVIRSCGYIEYAFESLLEHYAKIQSSPNIQSFIASTHGQGRNPWPTTLESRLEAYSSKWKEDLSTHLSNLSMNGINSNREVLSNLVKLRNKIAHGDSQQASLRTVLSYPEFAIAFVEELDNIILRGVQRS